MIKPTLLFILLIVSPVLAGDKIWITLYGELENPGLMQIEKNMTLADLMTKKAILLPDVAATNRIRLFRSNKSYIYDLKSNPVVIIRSRDVITVPPKKFYDDQLSKQIYRFEVSTKNPLKSYQQIQKIKIEGAKSHFNSFGFEFRPLGKTLQESWSRAVVKMGTDSIIVDCRYDPFEKSYKKLPYQTELEKKIRIICASEINKEAQSE